MCIAILQKPKNMIRKKVLRNCWNNNSDGAGMLWVEDGKLRAFKELDDFNKFYKAYVSVNDKVGRTNNIVLHFRIATHGMINRTNCHPHFVHNDLGFVHNGIIYGVTTTNNLSDTIAFNEQILKGLPKDFLLNDSILELIDGFSTSKFIFLDSDDNYTIIGKGEWVKGNWFSNGSYKKSYYTTRNDAEYESRYDVKTNKWITTKVKKSTYKPMIASGHSSYGSYLDNEYLDYMDEDGRVDWDKYYEDRDAIDAQVVDETNPYDDYDAELEEYSKASGWKDVSESELEAWAEKLHLDKEDVKKAVVRDGGRIDKTNDINCS